MNALTGTSNDRSTTIPAAVTTAAQLAEEQTAPSGLARSNLFRTIGVIVAVALLVATVMLSTGVGSRTIGADTIWDALWAYDDSHDEHAIVYQLRVPRTVVGLIVGPALGISGALIQAFTRNPLADPGILGVNAGAAFAVTLAFGVLGVTAPLGYVWFALIGAALVTIVVYLLGSVGGRQATPVKLTLAGVAMAAVLGGVTSAIVLASRDTFEIMRFWGVGSIGGRDLGTVFSFAPFIAVGILLAFFAARSLNALALGDELATSLGVKIGRIRISVILAVTLLAGTATALAGPIGFLGLMVPHVVRWFIGPDQRWIIAYTVVVSPILLLAADIVGRVILPSGELRVGLVTAIVGAPLLIILARGKAVSGL